MVMTMRLVDTGLALLAGLSMFAVAAAAQQTDANADIELMQRADAARMVASETAQIMIDEFIDFACPDCRQFQLEKSDSLQALVAEEDVIFVLRVYPIPRLLRGFQAAEAAFCAAAYLGRPGFWGMARQIFEHQSDWRFLLDPTPVFESYAGNIEVPMDEYRDCVTRDAMAPLIINDIRLASAAGVPGTPTFVFNKRDEFNGEERFYGVQPMSKFEESLERVRQR
jgi:protein-disulfide isomerase